MGKIRYLSQNSCYSQFTYFKYVYTVQIDVRYRGYIAENDARYRGYTVQIDARYRGYTVENDARYR